LASSEAARTTRHDIIVIGTSAGGIVALQVLLSDLPSDLNAAVFIVIHVSPQGGNILPSILARKSKLPLTQPEDGETIQFGHIYLTCPDHHLLVEPGKIQVTREPKENRYRPAIDLLFRSAARAYGPRVIGVVLTGMLDDGTAGLRDIKRGGGIAVVQDPETALFPGMPSSAISKVSVDYILQLDEIAPTLAMLVRGPAKEGAKRMAENIEIEHDFA